MGVGTGGLEGEVVVAVWAVVLGTDAQEIHEQTPAKRKFIACRDYFSSCNYFHTLLAMEPLIVL